MPGFDFLGAPVKRNIIAAMLDWLAPYGQGIALVAAIIAAFGVYLSNRHAQNEATELRSQLLERADENARLQAELRVAAEETMRQVTGQGGYSIVLPYFTQISPEIVKREGIAIPDEIPTGFGILNNSDAPVFAPLVIIAKTVPIGEGTDGTDRIQVYRGRPGDVFPGMGPTMLNARSTIDKSRTNTFDIVVGSRAVTTTQRIVVAWDGEQWQTDFELRQLEDADRGVEARTLHEIRADFPYVDESGRAEQ